MTYTPTPRGEGEVTLAQLAQHQRWVDARARLDGPSPAPRPKRPRPLSPFNPARQLRDSVRNEPERWQRIFTAAIIELDDDGNPVPDQRGGLPTWRKIAAEVSKKHHVSVLDMVSSRRSAFIVAARYEAFWRCRQETTMSLPQIGYRFGRRDHTTVLHGIRMHEKRSAEAANE